MNNTHTIEDIYPLSPLQQGMLFHTLYAPNSRAYFHQYICSLQGDLDIPAFKKAWQRVIDRHTVLRTAFEWEELGEPVQVVNRGIELPIELLDWEALTREELEGKFESFLEESRKLGFDLSAAPLIRLSLIRIAGGLYRFIWSHHHLLLDGWSVSLVMKEVLSFYEAYRENRELVIEESLPYREYISWLKRQDLRKAEKYWRKELEGFSHPTHMWVDQNAGGLPSQQDVYSYQHLHLNREATAKLQKLARKHRLTMNTILQGAWGVLLSKQSGDQDVVFGVTIAGRPVDLHGAESMIGLFTNTLALRLYVNHDLPIMDWLKSLQRQQIDLQQYSYSPLTQVHEWSEIPRGIPLFESVLVFQNLPFDPVLENTADGLKITDVIGYERNNLPLTIVGAPGQEMLLGILYDYSRYDHEIVRLILQHLETILEAIGVNSNVNVGDLPSLSQAEQKKILGEWNRTESEYESQKCIHELIENRVEARPDAIAVTYEDREVSYRDLNSRANQLARYLRELGVKPETKVGICLNRSAEMIEAALGVLKAGAAYVPLDPTYPLERLVYMLEDAEILTLISSQELAENLPAYIGRIISVDADREIISRYSVNNLGGVVTARNLAYVIYTSGSTGQPKGVGIEHRGLCNAAQAQANLFRLTPEDRVLQFASLSFDASIFEIMLALTMGASLHMASREVLRSGQGLMDLIDERYITTAVLPPSILGAIAGARRPSLKTLIVAGEPCPASVVERWGSGRHFINAYGPTEFTIWATAEKCEVGSEKPSIGRPIQNTQVYILDERVTPAPVGVAGELCLSGAGLARGYANRGDLTAERFIPNPFSGKAGERMYRTGDLSRYLPDGRIDFIGRKDHQVKVRGYRIELGEIESALNKHPAVEKSVVLLREGEQGDNRLIAYLITAAGSNTTAEEFRSHLKDSLPEFMTPSAFVTLESMPLLPNGKIDKKALSNLGAVGYELCKDYVPPTNASEESLAKVWSEVLGVERVSIDDSFFVLGGDSIRGIQLVVKAQENGFNFSLHELFQKQTVRALARSAENQTVAPVKPDHSHPFRIISEEDRLRLPDDIVDAYPLTMLQAGMVYHSEYSPDTYHTIISVNLRITIDFNVLRKALEYLVVRHPVLRTSFDLTGFSRPLQLVHEQARLPLEVEDLRHLTAAEQERAMAEWMEIEKRRPFNWTDYPLVRFQIHRLANDIIQFTYCGPHAVFDGWSDGIYFTELFKSYFAILNGETYFTEPPLTTFGDYVALEQEALQSEECREYWKQKLSDRAIATLPHWPRIPGAVDDPQVDVQVVPIPAEVSTALERIAKMAGVSLKSVLLAAHFRVLCLLTGQTDLITGMVSSGRPEAPGGEQIIGLFLNTLPLRLKLRGGAWIDLARDVSAAEAEAMPFRRYPLAQIQRENDGPPLFSTAFTFINFHLYQSIQDFEGAEVLGVTGFGKTNLALGATFILDSNSNLLKLTLSNDTVQISSQQLETIRNYYVRALALIANDPYARYEIASLLPAHEERRLLVEWNRTESPSERREKIWKLFENQVEERPESISLIFDELYVSYRELNIRAGQLASHLTALGVGPEKKVGICLNPGAEMIVAVLGVLGAGAAYVPLEPAYPLERLTYMLEDAQVVALITESELAEKLPTYWGHVVCLDSEWDRISTSHTETSGFSAVPENLAYIIYTSGSTGQPKGVMVNQQSLLNRALSFIKNYGIDSNHRLYQFIPLSFDAAAEEIFPALLSGASLVLQRNPTDVLPGDLPQWGERFGVTTLHLPPAYLDQISNGSSISKDSDLSWSRLLITGGEGFSAERLGKWLRLAPNSRFINAYGPTEATITSTIYQAPEDLSSIEGMRVPIGRPIDHTQVYILDEQMMPAPVRVAGELYISGVGLARGYAGQPDLTAERFVPNPFSEKAGERMYRTGDICLYWQDGTIDLIGRKDSQIKLRGYRIELGEIESALSKFPEVRDAVVAVSDEDGGEKRLIGFVVPNQPEALSASELQSFLRQRLPEYMTPTAYIMLDSIPLTLNNKIDRKALLDRARERSVSGDSFATSCGPVEEIITAIWSQILGLERIGIHQNFYELGGHSLLIMQLVSRIRNIFHVEVQLRHLLDAPTVAGMARVVQAARDAEPKYRLPSITRVSRDEELPLSFAQQQFWLLHQLDPGATSYNCPIAFRLRGRLNIQILEEALNDVIARHETLRTTFPADCGKPKQLIGPAFRVDLTPENLCELPEKEREAMARRLVAEEAEWPFDLSKGPLIRVKAMKLSEEEHVMSLVLPHIVGDAWTMGVLINDLSTFYKSRIDGEPSPLPELEIQYADYAYWQRKYLTEELLNHQLEYWRKKLDGELPTLEMIIDRQTTAERSQRVAHEEIILSPELTQEIKALSRREGVTLFILLLAAFKVLLHRYSGQEDIIVGTSIANRNSVELENLVGLFLNTLPLRTDLSGDPTFLELLARVREAALEAYAHQDIPFEKLVDELQPERSSNQIPLFRASFLLQNAPTPTIHLPGLSIDQFAVEGGTAKIDLSMTMAETEQRLVGALDYNVDRFDEVTMQKTLLHFRTLLEGIVKGADQPLSSLRLLSEAESDGQSSWDFQDVQLSQKDFENILVEMANSPSR